MRTTVRLSGAMCLLIALASPAQAVPLMVEANFRDSTGDVPAVSGTDSSSTSFDAIETDAWFGNTSFPYLAGGYASARIEGGPGSDLQIGTAALARAFAIYIGGAAAMADAGVRVQVRIGPPVDPLSLAAWTLSARICVAIRCVLETNFQHDSRGRFAVSSTLSDAASASFEESLTITGLTTTVIAGTARVNNDRAGGGGPVLQIGGGWNQGDFTAFGPASAATLGVFPADDPRNVADPSGDVLFGYDLRHTDFVPGQIALFNICGMDLLCATYDVTVEQSAKADFGALAAEEFGTLIADFAHTSSLGVLGVFDPSGQFDLSNSQISVRYLPSPTAVPEPASWLLTLSGLLLLGAQGRSRNQREQQQMLMAESLAEVREGDVQMCLERQALRGA